jgi:hypothetical protein
MVDMCLLYAVVMRRILTQKRISNASLREFCADKKLTRMIAKFLNPLRVPHFCSSFASLP